ncbi:292_t:CDS:1, partial [Funneliformis geosporum]
MTRNSNKKISVNKKVPVKFDNKVKYQNNIAFSSAEYLNNDLSSDENIASETY